MSSFVRIALVAGEVSGDILGAGLIHALQQRIPNAQFEGIGGELMQAQGLHSFFPMERLSVMGLSEVLGRLFELLRIRSSLVKRWIDSPPDIFIGIDAPDFNLGLERKLKQSGILCVHYVSPSIWAWRPNRIHGIIKSNDLMLTLFPFETTLYQQHQHPVVCVGHPLADQFPVSYDRDAICSQIGLECHKTWIALMPGSRDREIDSLLVPFLETARLLYQTRPDVAFIIPAVNQAIYSKIEMLLSSQFAELPVKLLLKQSSVAMQVSEIILIASGTATLEALFCKKPMVVAYKLSSFTFNILKYLVHTPWVSLPNLLAQETLVPELLQEKASAEFLFPAIMKALDSPDNISEIQLKFKKIHESLRGNCNGKAAQAIVDLWVARRQIDE